MPIRYRHFLAALAILGWLLPACGGGGGGSSSVSPTPTSRAVFWSPPKYFTDNTPLVPSRDLLGFEIYIRQDPYFGPTDSPIATPSPMDNIYNLANVSPPLSKGVTYYVSLRTVTAEGVKSDFSPAVSFSLP
jgi:hypothetical protein